MEERAQHATRRPPAVRFSVPLLLWFLAAHVLLGGAMHLSSQLATLHAWISALGALGLTVAGRKVLTATAAVVYVAASDVLWRATEARFFYEGPKYVLAVGLAILLVRWVRRVSNPLPALYVLLLLPSVPLTLLALGPEAREPLSFNLSGPLALGVSALYFQQVRLRWSELRHLLLAAIGPLLALASNTLIGILTATDLRFGTESNYQTSGGFGPNQVSLTLGFGALACLVILIRDDSLPVRVIAGATGVWFFGQSAFTFSRGGTVNLVVAGGLLVLLHLGDPRVRRRVLPVVVLALLLGAVLFSRLDTVTGGALDQRFSDLSTTNRTSIANDDLRLLRENPVAGVGPGMASYQRLDGRGEAAHTEFTRLVAEHGLLGATALLMLVVTMLNGVRRRRTLPDAALLLAFGSWSLVAMTHAAMRVAVISLGFGLALALPSSRPD